jgi:hypothetical protein
LIDTPGLLSLFPFFHLLPLLEFPKLSDGWSEKCF